MSGSELFQRLQLLKREIEDVSSILDSSSSSQFSIDDGYEVEYIVECLEKNARRLKSVVQSYRHQIDEEVSLGSSSAILQVSTPVIAGESNSDSNTSVNSDTELQPKHEQLLIDDSDATLSEDLSSASSPIAAHHVCVYNV
jgi:hypothetical protein